MLPFISINNGRKCRNFSMASPKKLQHYTRQFQTEPHLESKDTLRPNLFIGIKKSKKKQVQLNLNHASLIQPGQNSSVYKMEIQELQKQYAIKVKKINKNEKDRELLILRTLSHSQGHPNIVQLHHFFITNSLKVITEIQRYLNLVTDFIPMNLRQFILHYKSRHKQIPAILVKLFAYQLIRGLAFLHEHNIVHRDLCPENILVDSTTFQLKICDFGLAKFMQRGEISICQVGNIRYRAPELFLGAETYSISIDLWSVGCIIHELNTQDALFEGNSNENLFSEIIKKLGTPTHEDLVSMHSPILDIKLPIIKNNQWEPGELVKKMIQYQPQRRGTAFQYLLNEYFKELHKPNIRINGHECPELFNFTPCNIAFKFVYRVEELSFERYREDQKRLIPEWAWLKYRRSLDEEDIQTMLNQKMV